ncbi:excisionase family DNA-binding protein [Lentzea sp. NPDC051208]|uniref:excisionase family DNA-binding protein n=1 Tax=Lentzea sp. NPDC051208 TaxID=3154642 RepID=UPI003443C147
MSENIETPVEHIVLTVEQAAKRLNIGRTLMYELVSSGEVESVHIGRLRRVPLQALTNYVNKLMTSTPNPEAA